MKKSISQQLAEKTYQELGFDPDGKPVPDSEPSKINKASPRNSYQSPTTPFHISTIEKTKRQSARGKSYKYSALYRNGVVLRLFVIKFTDGLPRNQYRLKSQLDSAARSIVANIREGYTRPTTREYLDFLGFSAASLEEVRGDIEDARDDNLLPSRSRSTLASIGIHLKPISHQKQPVSPKVSYDPLEALKRQVGDIKRNQLTYEIFRELINKTDYLMKRTVNGLQEKVVRDEKTKLYMKIDAHSKKHW